MKKYRGKHLRINKAKGFRLGFGYIPHYQSNLDISVDRAQSLMIWCGPYIIAWDYSKRGYEPRMPWDPDRLDSLDQARADLTLEIARAMRAKRRWGKHLVMGQVYGMGAQKQFEANKKFIEDEIQRVNPVHEDVARRWQAESDAVKLREMEDAERNAEDSRD